jgi:pyridoxal phosphate enzyme (YggS family)
MLATNIPNNIALIQQRIAQVEAQYHRPAGSVTLLAASKNQSIEKIKAAYDAGLKVFGESYLQEALEKIAALSSLPIEWHFIGSIQSNKTKKIAAHFSFVHSVTSTKIAKRLNDQRPVHLPPLNICIEVNLDKEPTKSGVNPDEAHALAAYCATLPRLKLRGLMTIPAPLHDLLAQRENFRHLFKLWQTLNHHSFALDVLSMGMSDDLEAAIAEGSTLVRIGTAIFGER